jgi:hypothetical protein
MDAVSACGFFDLILGLFVEAEAGGIGKLVGKFILLLEVFRRNTKTRVPVLDEAHKVSSCFLLSSVMGLF